jgi:hypothetical protein
MDVWMDVVNGRTEKYVHECNGAMGGSDASPGRNVGNCSSKKQDMAAGKRRVDILQNSKTERR